MFKTKIHPFWLKFSSSRPKFAYLFLSRFILFVSKGNYLTSKLFLRLISFLVSSSNHDCLKMDPWFADILWVDWKAIHFSSNGVYSRIIKFTITFNCYNTKAFIFIVFSVLQSHTLNLDRRVRVIWCFRYPVWFMRLFWFYRQTTCLFWFCRLSTCLLVIHLTTTRHGGSSSRPFSSVTLLTHTSASLYSSGCTLM